MRKFLWHMLYIIVLTLASATYVDAQCDPSFLKRIDSLFVVVEDFKLTNDLQYAGVTPDEIKRNVELELRTRGIRVKKPALAYLYVNVNLMPIDDNSDKILRYAYSIHIELIDLIVPAYKLLDYATVNEKDFKKQFLTSLSGIQGKAPIVGTGVTWTQSSLGVIGISKLAQLKDLIIDVLKDFINDYLNANQN